MSVILASAGERDLIVPVGAAGLPGTLAWLERPSALVLFARGSGSSRLSPRNAAVAGQLRTITGLAAGVAALAVGRAGTRLALQHQLLAGAVLLGLGSLASAAAPSLALLAAAQALVGVGAAIVTTAGTLAAAEWVAPEQRTRVLSWALIGQPAAWAHSPSTATPDRCQPSG